MSQDCAIVLQKRVVRSPGQEFKTSLTNMVKPWFITVGNFVFTKYTKISRVWWRAPVIPATEEAEAEETLES